MQIAQDNATASPALGVALPEAGAGTRSPYADYKVIRRNGAVVGFEPDKIAVAMTKAFLAVHGNSAAASAGVRDKVHALTQAVVQSLVRRQPNGGTFHIEDIQDQVELAMMRAGEHQVARSYDIFGGGLAGDGRRGPRRSVQVAGAGVVARGRADRTV